MTDLSARCEHGGLCRNCDTCHVAELEAEIRVLRAKVAIPCHACTWGALDCVIKERPHETSDWTGWPGAICMHCHQVDAREVCLADNCVHHCHASDFVQGLEKALAVPQLEPCAHGISFDLEVASTWSASTTRTALSRAFPCWHPQVQQQGLPSPMASMSQWA